MIPDLYMIIYTAQMELFGLPDYLWMEILNGWLYPEDLCRLDSTGKVVQRTLDKLYCQHTFVLKANTYLADSCVCWLASRHIKVKLIQDTFYNNGNIIRKLNGKIHHNILPAIIYQNGTRAWYQHGLLHRDNDFPAVIYANGDRAWYRHGLRHRGNDKPAVIYVTGDRIWYFNGKLHRNVGAAVVWNDNQMQLWYKHGKRVKQT